MERDKREVMNRDRPAGVPLGSIEVIVHVVWSDGAEEWRPARGIRWTSTHVMVGWLEESGDQRDEHWEWLPAQDVMRSVRWLVPPARG